MKIKKYAEDYYVIADYYDTIYVQLGIGCCEKLSRCKSHNIDNTDKKFDVDISTLTLSKTPYQWIKEVKEDAIILGPQTISQRSVTFIQYTNDEGNIVQMWIDDTYGVPHKIVIVDSDDNELARYQFNDMLFNGIKDNDMEAPCA